MRLRTIRESWRHWWRLSRIAKYDPIPGGYGGRMETHAVNCYTHREWKPWHKQLAGPHGVLP